jgi:uncharacterized protein with GYD domain
MTTYVTLIRFTSAGPDSITDFGKAWEEAARHISSMGIKVVSAYGLLGPYDMMIVYEAADQKSAARLPLSLSSLEGGIKTETWTTIPLEEFVKLPEQVFCEWPRRTPTS